jgi:hypothetical protein
MTHDPHFPTLEQIMHNNPFELVDSPWGHIERWRASTLSTGTMGALAQVHAIVRDDAAAVAARADAEEARTALIQHLCDKVADFQRRFDDHVARLAKAEEQRRADEEAQREFEEEPIELPPNLEPDIVEDDTHVPGGELHALPPSEVPEPSLELEGDQSEFPDPELPKPPQVEQPTAIEFDDED